MSNNIPSHPPASPSPVGANITSNVFPLSRGTKARLEQQRKFMNNVRDPPIKKILPELREAVDALNRAQTKAGDNVRLHLMVENETVLGSKKGDSLFHQSSMMSLYSFFSPTIVADTEFKKSMVREFGDLFAKFQALQTNRFTAHMSSSGIR